MKKPLILLVTAAFIINAVTAQVSFGKPEKINSSWKFKLGEVESASAPGFNDQRWENIDLPHDWSVQGQLSPTLASCTGYLPGGIGWYRKSIEIPASKKGEKIELTTTPIYLESITEETVIFCKIIAPPNLQPVDKRWPDAEVAIRVRSKK